MDARVPADERARRKAEAVTTGATAGAVGAAAAMAVAGGAHLLLTATVPAYRAASVYPKRIAAAVAVALNTGFQSHHAALQLAQRYNDLDAAALEAEDDAAREAVRRGALRAGAGGSRAAAPVAAPVAGPAPAPA